MMRAICLIIAVILLVLASVAVDGPTINGHATNLLVLGLAFWALSFLAIDDLRRPHR